MEQNHEYFDKVLKLILEENNLKIKQIPEGRHSLMKAISDSLYFTTVHHKKIQKICLDYLTQTTLDKLSNKLREFRENEYLFKDYCENPHLRSFQNINMLIVSRVFSVSINVFSVNALEVTFNCFVFNNRADRRLRLLKRADDHFDTLYNQKEYKVFGFCQNIVFNMFSWSMGGDRQWRNVNKGRYINIEFENWKKRNKSRKTRINGSSLKKALSTKSDSLNKFTGMTPPRPNGGQKPFLSQIKDAKEKPRNFDIFTSMQPNRNVLRLISGKKETPQKLESSLLAVIENSYNKILSDEVTSESGNGNTNAMDSPTKRHIENFEDSGSRSSTPKNMNFDGSASFHSSSTYPRYEFNPSGVNIFAQEVNLNDIEFEDKTPAKEKPVIPNLQKELFSTPRYQFAQNALHSSPVKQAMVNQDAIFGNFDRKNPVSSDEPLLIKNLKTSSSSFPSPAAPPPPHPQAPNVFFPQGSFMNQLPQIKRKPIILDEGKKRYTGRLKFFDENKNYGFIIMDDDGSDIFVHYDDLSKANLPKEFLRTAKKGKTIKLSFTCLSYIGKHNRSKKAVDLQLIAQRLDQFTRDC